MSLIDDKQANKIIRALWNTAKQQPNETLQTYFENPQNRLDLQKELTDHYYTQESLAGYFESDNLRSLRNPILDGGELSKLLGIKTLTQDDDETVKKQKLSTTPLDKLLEKIIGDDNLLDEYESELIANALYAKVMTKHTGANAENFRQLCDQFQKTLVGQAYTPEAIQNVLTKTFGETHTLTTAEKIPHDKWDRSASDTRFTPQTISTTDFLKKDYVPLCSEKNNKTVLVNRHNLDNKLEPITPMTSAQARDVINMTESALAWEDEKKKRYLELELLARRGTVENIAAALEKTDQNTGLSSSGQRFNEAAKKRLGFAHDSSADSPFQKLLRKWKAEETPPAPPPIIHINPANFASKLASRGSEIPSPPTKTNAYQASLVVQAIVSTAKANAAKFTPEINPLLIPDSTDNQWENLTTNFRTCFFKHFDIKMSIENYFKAHTNELPQSLTTEDIVGQNMLDLNSESAQSDLKDHLQSLIRSTISLTQEQLNKRQTYREKRQQRDPNKQSSPTTPQLGRINATFDWNRFKVELPKLLDTKNDTYHGIVKQCTMNQDDNSTNALDMITTIESVTDVQTFDLEFADNSQKGNVKIHLQNDSDGHKKYDYVVYPPTDDKTLVAAFTVLDASTTLVPGKKRRIHLIDEDWINTKASKTASELEHPITNKLIELTPREKVWIYAKLGGFETHETEEEEKKFIAHNTRYAMLKDVLTRKLQQQNNTPPPAPNFGRNRAISTAG